MAKQRKRTEAEEKELLELMEKYRIDPEVNRQAQELADQGRWEEHGALIVNYVQNHPALVSAMEHSRAHPEEGVPLREILRKLAGG
jgi:hypothetical protein